MKALWQPIETAPKDGTSVLLWTANGIIEGYWMYGEWDQSVTQASYDMARAYIECTPTHWMPLPPPPGCDADDDHDSAPR